MKNDHVSNHQHFEGIDYAFRPESYWHVADPLGAILVNVKGTRRRQMIRDYCDAGAMDDLQQGLLLDCLGEEDRVGLGKIHPSFMGGEYLPHYERGQIEIARVELQSTTGDVISIRASKEGERIAYSVVDDTKPSSISCLPRVQFEEGIKETIEYFKQSLAHLWVVHRQRFVFDGRFCPRDPTHSDKPLTLSEQVRLIDGAMEEGSLGLCYTQMNYEGGERSIEWLDQMRHFTRVESLFYPQLNLHYEKVLSLWYEEEKAKLVRGSGLD